MTEEEFELRNKRAWEQAISRSMGKTPPKSATWQGVDNICAALGPFMGHNLNHALLPGGGGMDFNRMSLSRELGCLEIGVAQKVNYVVKPKTLYFEFLDASPENSFFLLELSKLEQSGIYSNVYNDYEELVEIEREYVNREVWDRGIVGFDSEGSEIPLPSDARLVIRLLSGKILLTAKTSLWNSDPGTYDGRHNLMTAARVRDIIENSLHA